jgi:hypothetical protein
MRLKDTSSMLGTVLPLRSLSIRLKDTSWGLGTLQTPRSFDMLIKDTPERPGMPLLPIILFFHLRLEVEVNIFVYI